MSRTSVCKFYLFAAVLILLAVSPSHADPAACTQQSGEAAVKACTAAIDSGAFKGEELAGLHFRRGTLFFDLDLNDRALQDFDAAIRHAPNSSAAYSGRASVHMDNNDHDRAIRDFDTALKLDPANAYALENRGDVFVRLGKFKEAIRDYDATLKLTPDNPWSMYGRGLAKLKSGDTSGTADIAAAKKMSAKVADEFTEIVGVKP